MDLKSEEMSCEDIKEKLENHYYGPKIGRKLSVIRAHNCYFFELEGTPPKGYGIYIPELQQLSLYDYSGKRFKQYSLSKGIKDFKK